MNHWLQMALLCCPQVGTVCLHARTITVETNWNSRQPASTARMSCMARWFDPLRFTCFSYKLHDSHESTVIDALSWSSCVLSFLFLGNLFTPLSKALISVVHYVSGKIDFPGYFHAQLELVKLDGTHQRILAFATPPPPGPVGWLFPCRHCNNSSKHYWIFPLHDNLVFRSSSLPCGA
jgi:hypothetical protein